MLFLPRSFTGRYRYGQENGNASFLKRLLHLTEFISRVGQMLAGSLCLCWINMISIYILEKIVPKEHSSEKCSPHPPLQEITLKKHNV